MQVVGFIVGVAVGVSVVSAMFLLLLWWHNARNNHSNPNYSSPETSRSKENQQLSPKLSKRESKRRKQRRHRSPFRVPPSATSGSSPADSPQPTYFLGVPNENDAEDYDPSWSDVENQIDSATNSDPDPHGYSMGPFDSKERLPQRKRKSDRYQQANIIHQQQECQSPSQPPIHLPDLGTTDHHRCDSSCSFSTVDYDYAKARSANSSVISSVGGTDGENFSKDDEASSLGSSSLIWNNINTEQSNSAISASNGNHIHPQIMQPTQSLHSPVQQEDVRQSSTPTEIDDQSIVNNDKQDVNSVLGSLSLSTSSHSAFSSAGSSLIHQQGQRIQHSVQHQMGAFTAVATSTTIIVNLPLPTPPLGMVLRAPRHSGREISTRQRDPLVHALKESSPLLQNENHEQVEVGDVLVAVDQQAVPQHWSAVEISKWIRRASKKATRTNVPLSLTFERKSMTERTGQEHCHRASENPDYRSSTSTRFEGAEAERKIKVTEDDVSREERPGNEDTPIYSTDCDDNSVMTDVVERADEEEQEIVFIKAGGDSTATIAVDEKVLFPTFHRGAENNDKMTIHGV